MSGNYLRVTDKELFYTAMMLKLDRLVDVEYDFPADEAKLASELEDVKLALHRRKLLKESAKGEITLDYSLSACAAFCAQPESCEIVDEGGYRATIYGAVGVHMLLERLGGGESEASWFSERESLDEYIEQRLAGGSDTVKMANIAEGAAEDGGV